jgi:pSer/pThr/pTyr-binding forkhead associated (FHA) protein
MYNSDMAFNPAMYGEDPNSDLQRRLNLYQVFQRLYEQNRGLLDEILNLEVSGSKSLRGFVFPYMQGIVLDHEILLVTNLMNSQTQALSQAQNIWTIGRDSRQVTIPVGDTRLSRRHAAIEYIPHEGFYLSDLKSSNGSFVNGELVRQHKLLCDGDQIRLGSLTFNFFYCDAVKSIENLSAEQLSRISLVNLPVTAPLNDSESTISDGRLPHDRSHANQHNHEEAIAEGLEDTSMFMRQNKLQED